MKKIQNFLAAVLLAGCNTVSPVRETSAPIAPPEVQKTNEEWKKQLTPEQYAVTCEGSTEAPFTGKYWDHHESGVYQCVRCGNLLFSSKSKFDSGTGWPSFSSTVKDSSVAERVDTSFNTVRQEIICNRCGAHLGHVFDDGPAPTGMRYCVNSAALDFKPEEKK